MVGASAGVLLALAALLPIPALAQVVSISSSVSEMIEGDGGFDYTLERTGPTTAELVVSVQLEFGILARELDHTIEAGKFSVDGQVPWVQSNGFPDGGRTFVVSINAAEGYSVDAAAGSVSVHVKNIDKGLLLSASSLTVRAGATATYRVQLATEPSGSVVVTPSVASGASVSVAPATLTFSSTNWSDEQMFTVTAATGSDAATVSVGHSVSTSYLSTQTETTVPSISVTVEEDPRPTVTIAAATSPVTEGTAAVFTVTRSAVADTGLQVSVTATESGSFAANALPSSVTIAAGATTERLTIATEDDAVPEADGSVTVTIAEDATKYVIGTASSATVAIEDNDAPTYTLDLSGGGTQTERVANLEFTVTLDRSPAVQITADWATADDTAVAGQDYTAANGSVEFAAGATGAALTKTFTVALLDDTADEADEQFTVTLSNAQGTGAQIGTGTATVTITDDDEPALSIADARADENVAGGTMPFTVTLSPAAHAAVTVDYVTTDGTAEQPGDYTTARGTLTFATGATTRTIAVAVVNDAAEEADETFTVTLRNVSAAATLDDATATGTIVDDDPPAGTPVVSISSLNSEITEGGGIDYTLTRTGPTTAELAVSVQIEIGTTLSVKRNVTIAAGKSSVDGEVPFVQSNGFPDKGRNLVVSINTGEGYSVDAAAGSVTVHVKNIDKGLLLSASSLTVRAGAPATYEVQLATEPSGSVVVTPSVPSGASVSVAPTTLTFSSTNWSAEQTFTVTAATGSDAAQVSVGHSVSTSYLSTGQQTATAVPSISVTVEEDPRPAVTIAAATSPVTEGTAAVFTVTRSAVADTELQVSVTATESGSFAAALPSSVTIAADATTERLTIATVDDDVTEADGSVTVTIAADAGYRVGTPASATVAIEDDDLPIYTLNLAGTATRTEANEDLAFTVTIGESPVVEVTVDWATSEGTAKAGSDYTDASGTVTFAAADTALSKSFTVAIVDDTQDEPQEQFTVSLSNAQGATINTGTATVTITDDDEPALSIGDETVQEDVTGGMIGFQVDLSLPSALEITVDYATTDGTATAPADYAETSGTLTFAAGATTHTVAVAVVNDGDDEAATETFTVTLSNPSATATLGDHSATGSIVDDDGPPTLSLEDASATEGAAAMVFAVKLSGTATSDVSATWSTRDGTATAPDDYTAVTAGTVAIPAGDTEASLTVQLAAGNDVDEADREFTVTLASPTPSTVPLGRATATGTIADDDLPTVTIEKVADVTEGAEARFTLSRAGVTTGPLAVAIAVTQDGAVLDTDETPPASATFEPGSDAVAVAVATDDDELDEANGSITVTVTGGDTYAAGTPAAATVAVADNDLPVVTISSSATEVTEGGSLPIEVSRVGDLSAALEVILTISATNDYVITPRGTVHVEIAAEASSATMSVTVADDDFARGTGSVNVVMIRDSVALARYRVGSPSTFSGTIRDNDESGVPAVIIRDQTCAEDPVNAQCNVSFYLTSAATSQFIVIARTRSGTATSEVDFGRIRRLDRRVTVFEGADDGAVTIAILGDDLDEDDETFTVELSLGQSVTPDVATIRDGVAVVTIRDDDDPPSLTIDDSSASEGSGSMRFVATLDEVSGRDVLVNWATSDGTATAPADYTSAGGTVTIDAGNNSANIDVTVNEDTDPESSETFQVTITSAQATVTDGAATGRIDDNDVSLTLSVGSNTIGEGESTTVTVQSAIPLPGARTITLELSGAATHGTGGDYTLVPASITIPVNGTSGTATVTALQDTLVETGGETVTITARTGGATIGSATITISDDDIANFALSVSPAEITEGGTATATVTAATGGVTFAAVQTITLALSGSAEGSGTDYTISSTSIEIAAGDLSGTATVTPVDDDIVEGNETITIEASHGAAAIGTRNLSLLDDDEASLVLGVSRSTVTEGDPAVAIVTVSTTGDAVFPTDQIVALALTGTATQGAGNDYTLVPSSITIAAGDTSGSATVTPLEDNVVEGEETITIAASHAGTAIGSADITVADNDTATLSLTIAPASVTEGETTTITVQTAGNTFAAAQTIDLDLAGSTATLTADFTLSPPSITIAPGATSGSAAVAAVDDNVVEDSEEIAIAASHDGTGIGNGTITIADNDTATFGVTVDPPTIAEGETTTLVLETGGATFPDVQRFNLVLSGTATTDADYTVAPAGIEIVAGDTEGSAVIAALDDTLVEDAETIDIEVRQDTTVVGTASVTISASDQSSFTLAVDPATVTEGGSVTVTVESGGVTFVDAQEVVLALSGSATNEEDYTISSTTITIVAGATSGTAVVTTSDDTLVEGDETITIGASHDGDQIDTRNVTISDNDSASFTLTVDPATVAEGATATVTVETVGGVTFDTTQNIALVLTGTATQGAGNDYTISSTSLAIAVGATSGSVTLTTVQDSLAEGRETIAIAASLGGTQVASANAVIADDDLAGFTVSVAPDSLTEGDPATATLTVEIGGGVTFPVAQTISLTFGGSATADSDYTVTPSSITLPAGATSGTAVVAPLDDTIAEGDETILITASLGDAEIGAVELALADDDADLLAFSLTVDPATIAEGETATVTVDTGGATFDAEQTITLTLGGSATEGAGNDYTITPPAITIAANATAGSATIAARADGAIEEAETITISASHGDATVGTAEVIIAGGGTTAFSLAVAPATVEEGATATVTVSTGGTTFAEAQTITLAFSGSASEGSDFSVSSSSIEIAAGSESGTATITALDDSNEEAAETITITASHDGTAIGTRNITIAASDLLALSLTVAPAAIEEGESAIVTVATDDGAVRRGCAEHRSGLQRQRERGERLLGESVQHRDRSRGGVGDGDRHGAGRQRGGGSRDDHDHGHRRYQAGRQRTDHHSRQRRRRRRYECAGGGGDHQHRRLPGECNVHRDHRVVGERERSHDGGPRGDQRRRGESAGIGCRLPGRYHTVVRFRRLADGHAAGGRGDGCRRQSQSGRQCRVRGGYPGTDRAGHDAEPADRGVGGADGHRCGDRGGLGELSVRR